VHLSIICLYAVHTSRGSSDTLPFAVTFISVYFTWKWMCKLQALYKSLPGKEIFNLHPGDDDDDSPCTKGWMQLGSYQLPTRLEVKDWNCGNTGNFVFTVMCVDRWFLPATLWSGRGRLIDASLWHKVLFASWEPNFVTHFAMRYRLVRVLAELCIVFLWQHAGTSCVVCNFFS